MKKSQSMKYFPFGGKYTARKNINNLLPRINEKKIPNFKTGLMDS